MDHGGMDHGMPGMDHGMPGMDHGGHGGHSMPGMDDMCKMNMLFNWDTTNLCIVFPSWHVRSPATFILSLVGVVLLTAGYEAVRELSRRYESRAAALAEYHNARPDSERSPLLPIVDRADGPPSAGARQTHAVKAALYAVQVFYSFFIMLLFMTYNGYIMIAVALGAFAGYLLFSNPAQTTATKTVACH